MGQPEMPPEGMVNPWKTPMPPPPPAADDDEDLVRQLSADQRRQIRDLTDQAEKDEARIRADLQGAEIDLRRALEDDNADEARVAQLVGQLAQLEGQARAIRIVTDLRIRKMLTRAQRELLQRH
jgi:Spy/CpxP family protein refolding chaperone